MDLTIDVEDYKLNVRSSGLIIHDNFILTHHNLESDHYALPGGRIEIGEDSVTTVKREFLEETGKEISVKGCAAVVENYFTNKGQKYHEILFAHVAEFKNEEDRKNICELENIEGKDYLKYEWLDINKIDEYELRPYALKEIIKKHTYPVHKVYKD